MTKRGRPSQESSPTAGDSPARNSVPARPFGRRWMHGHPPRGRRSRIGSRDAPASRRSLAQGRGYGRRDRPANPGMPSGRSAAATPAATDARCRSVRRPRRSARCRALTDRATAVLDRGGGIQSLHDVCAGVFAWSGQRADPAHEGHVRQRGASDPTAVPLPGSGPSIAPLTLTIGGSRRTKSIICGAGLSPLSRRRRRSTFDGNRVQPTRPCTGTWPGNLAEIGEHEPNQPLTRLAVTGR
jgi:hypothetical protein